MDQLETRDQFPDAEMRDDADSGAGLLQISQTLWRRKALVLLGATVGLVLGSLRYSRETPVYQSLAEVLLVQRMPSTALPNSDTSAGMSYVGNYTSAHKRVIESPLVIERAIDSGTLRKGLTAGAIAEGLTVDLDGEVLLLSHRGPNPEDCRAILEAVIASYQEFLDETYRNVNDDTLKQITQKAAQLQDQIQRLGEQYQTFMESKPLLWKRSDGASLYEERLSNIESRRSELAIEQAELDSRMAMLRRAVQEGEDREMLLAMIESLPDGEQGSALRPEGQQQGALAMERELLPLTLREQTLLEDYGAGHPDVKAVRRQIDMTREFYQMVAKIEGDSRLAEAGESESAQTLDPVEVYLAEMERTRKSLEATERALADLAQKEQDRAKQLHSHEFRERQLSGDLARAEEFYETLITQLQGVDITKDLGGYQTSVLTPPQIGYRVAPQLASSITPVAILGLLAGLGLVYVAEITDKRFRTPEDIRRQLGLPVVGHVPFHTSRDSDPQDAEALDPSLCVVHRPRSVYAEAYRGVRTALYFSAQGEQHKVIQITSPSAGDGKSTLAANLAASIAKAGNRVVLVDADLRKPRQHRLFRVPHETGLAAVISGKAELADALQNSGVDGLQILPCGPVPSDPSELLTSPRFAELLELLRSKFDFVIVDTPPLLVVTDPSVVAPRVDGVLLTIRITKGSTQLALRAKEILQTVKARVLGVVVNDQEKPGSAYGYGRYRYGYGYGYGRYRYGYGYGGYGSGGQDAYYRSDEEDAAVAGEGQSNGRGNGQTQRHGGSLPARNGSGQPAARRTSGESESGSP